MFRARLIASLLIPSAGLFCACSSSSSPTDTSSAGGPTGEVGCSQASGDTYTPGMQKLGDAGRYSFSILSSSPAPPAVNNNAFVVQVTDSDDNPVKGDLSVALDMPDHGHSSPSPDDIAFDAATGSYTLDPLDLFMVGLWRFTFSFQADSGSASDADSAVFKFCID